MATSQLVSSKWISWSIFAATAIGVGVTWHGPRAHRTTAPAPEDAVPAERSTRLVVDYRDDISSSALAAKGYVELPVSDYSARDRVYDVEFPTVELAEAARAKLARDPDVESVD